VERSKAKHRRIKSCSFLSFNADSALCLTKTQAGHKTLASFPNKAAYAEHIKSILRVGMKVVAVSGERKGDRGKYLGTNGGRPPCHVEWEDYGQGWWVEWHDVAIAEGAGQHAMKRVSGSVKCLACGMLGPSSQTGANFCEHCNICETCCESKPQCGNGAQQSDVAIPEDLAKNEDSSSGSDSGDSIASGVDFAVSDVILFHMLFVFCLI
jgi:hypothetical protein